MAAVLMLTAHSPVRRHPSQSVYSQIRVAARYVSGSFSASQRTLLSSHSADDLSYPLYLRAGSPVAAIRFACAAARTSIQMSAGRSGFMSSSEATTVQLVQATDSAR